MSRAYTTFNTRVTPPNQPIPFERQVQNNTGGFVYELDLFKAVERFLILGSEGGSFYVGEAKLTKESATRLVKAIEQDGKRVVDLIVAVSDGGRAVKNDPAIFALALAASCKSADVRAAALAALPKVCRIPTHLFHFLTYVKQFRGFGRGLKRAVGEWYSTREVDSLAYAMVKYQQRDGWSHADVLRLTHPKTTDDARNQLYRWAVDGYDGLMNHLHALEPGTDGGTPRWLPSIVQAFEDAKHAFERGHTKELIEIITKYNLSREMIPTEALTKPEVWEALLPKMKPMALIRNLGNMTKIGLLTPLSNASKLVIAKLGDAEALRRERVHPAAVLIAEKIYAQGHGMKGKGEWKPVRHITDALDDAFYLSFKVAEPTNKTFLFGVDVSGSMGWNNMAGVPLTPAEGAAAMALAVAKVEKHYHIMGFAHNFVDLGISTKDTLTTAVAKAQMNNFGSTDISLPMEWALAHNAKVDVFVVITDNELNTGRRHPKQALDAYRQKTGIAAKQVVMGMTATNFTVADPNDPLAMDVAGFDASVPQAIGEFARF